MFHSVLSLSYHERRVHGIHVSKFEHKARLSEYSVQERKGKGFRMQAGKFQGCFNLYLAKLIGNRMDLSREASTCSLAPSMGFQSLGILSKSLIDFTSTLHIYIVTCQAAGVSTFLHHPESS